MPWDMLWMLAAVIVILYLSYRCSRYIASRSGCISFSGKTGNGIEVLSRLPLAQDKQLILVQVGTRYLLLGVSPAGIVLITELTEEEAKATQSDIPEKPPSFADVLRDGWNNRKK